MMQFWQQMKLLWARLEGPQRVTIILIALACIGLISFLVWGASRPDWRVLASDLPAAKTAEIAAELQAQGVQYRISDHDTTVLVPSKDVYRLRSVLAEKEMLASDSKGFRLLDQTQFGQSTFMEGRNYDRAVAGELENSFRTLPGVKAARVIIGRPAQSPFLLDDKKPTVSVRLVMQSGQRLSRRQVNGITHLAAGSVEGMVASRVQVMDDTGLLTNQNDDPSSGLSGANLESKSSLENKLRADAQAQLDTLLGPGHSRVTIAADLDFTKKVQSSTNPGKIAALMTKTTSTNSSTPIIGSGGVAGTASNVEGDQTGGKKETAMATETREEETRQNTVGKETITIEDEIGRLRGMSVSIILDTKQVKKEKVGADGKATGEFELKDEERTEPEKEQVKQIVLDAIGFKSAKGAQAMLDPKANVDDRFTVTLVSMPFYRPITDEPEKAQGIVLGSAKWMEYARYGGIAIVLLGLLFIANSQIRGARRAWETEQAKRRREQEEAEEARRKLEESHKKSDAVNEEVHSQEVQRRHTLKEKVQKQVSENPAQAAAVVRSWMNGSQA